MLTQSALYVLDATR